MTTDTHWRTMAGTNARAEAAAYAMELDDMPIGVALAVRGGFVFHATDRSFFPLDGQRFQHVHQVSRALYAFARGSAVRKPAGRARQGAARTANG